MSLEVSGCLTIDEFYNLSVSDLAGEKEQPLKSCMWSLLEDPEEQRGPWEEECFILVTVCTHLEESSVLVEMVANGIKRSRPLASERSMPSS